MRYLPAQRVPWKIVNSKINLIRNADDFIITGTTKDVLEKEVRPLVEQFLCERGLQLSPEKICITHIDQGFDFLGQHLCKFGGTLLVRPSKKNTHAFLEKVLGIIDANKSASQESLIRQLNPVIRGWVNYHRHIVAAKAFQQVDHVVWCRLSRWARRRHPDKFGRWVKKRYFHPIDRRTGIFAADTGKRTPEGKPIWLKLVYASDTKIRRHLENPGGGAPVRSRLAGLF